MGLKAVVENLDDVDEAHHDLYEEKEGKFVLKPIEGLKPEAEVTKVHTALTKERNDHRATKKVLSAFGDLKPEDVTGLRERNEELEATLATGNNDAKVEALVTSRVKQATGPLQRERDKLTADLAAATSRITEFETKEVRGRISSALTDAARKSKVVDAAVDDIALLGQNLFEVTEAGVVTRDQVGVTPGLSPSDWLQEQRDRRPYWWPASEGGGAGGGRGGSGSVDNPWTKGKWNLTEQGKIVRADPAKAERLAKAAGSKLGAMTPPEK